MPKPVDLSIAINQPPKDAVAYFRSKGYKITDEWQDMLTHAHAKAFTVARGQSMDVLKAIRGELDAALAEGLTAKQFRERLTPQLQKLGWWGKAKNAMGDEIQLGSPYRLNTIYRQNMQTAYMAGRYRRQLATNKTHPYWQYVAIDDGQTRPEHKRLNGRTFRFDDPIWDVIYPPNGWGCRCRVRTLTAAQVKAKGLTVENGDQYIERFNAEITSRESGEIKTVEHARIKLPGGDTMTPDLGWAYSPGQSAYGFDVSIAQKIGKVNDAELRGQALQALNNSAERQTNFNLWMDESLPRIERYQAAVDAKDFDALKTTGPRPYNKTVVHFLDDDLNQKLLDKGIDAKRVITFSESNLNHAHSEKHVKAGKALDSEGYKKLPQLLSNAPAYWDSEHNNLMFVDFNGEEATRIIVDFNNKGEDLDALINIYKVPAAEVYNQINNKQDLIQWR